MTKESKEPSLVVYSRDVDNIGILHPDRSKGYLRFTVEGLNYVGKVYASFTVVSEDEADNANIVTIGEFD